MNEKNKKYAREAMSIVEHAALKIGSRPVCRAGGRRCGQGHIPAHDRKLGGPGRCQSLGGDTLGKKAGKHLHQP